MSSRIPMHRYSKLIIVKYKIIWLIAAGYLSIYIHACSRASTVYTSYKAAGLTWATAKFSDETISSYTGGNGDSRLVSIA